MKYLNQSFGTCMEGNCNGCHLVSICNQPSSFYDGHEEEVIEATCLKIRNCVKGLKEHMISKGYTKLYDMKYNALIWLRYKKEKEEK